jgi:MoaA/NifB/PqqE/SkfB family radical SAM enzyme
MVSEECNFVFLKETGYTEMWGATREEDPIYSPYGNLIADIELSTRCSEGCPACYKSNVVKGKSMTLETFKKLFSKLPKTLTQIAFGIGSVNLCPDMFPIFAYCRENGIIPNVTINGRVTKAEALQLVNLCGAVAVSRYSNDQCYNAVELLTSMGLKQVNIHQLVAEETFESCLELVENTKSDPRLKHLNASVYLSVKRKGRGESYHPLSFEKKIQLYKVIQESKKGYGFDSCGSHSFLKYLELTNQKELEQYVEPCESSLYSFYIDVNGMGFPCSFTPGTKGWETGIDVLNCEDFLSQVWFDKRVVDWRNNLLNCQRSCPLYQI